MKTITIMILDTKNVEQYYSGICATHDAFLCDEIIEAFDDEDELNRQIRHYERLGIGAERREIIRGVPINPYGFDISGGYVKRSKK